MVCWQATKTITSNIFIKIEIQNVTKEIQTNSLYSKIENKTDHRHTPTKQ